ncbi:MAG: choice-of-anchor J domain-containing protein [Wenzhouxiangella sp.]
MPENQSSSRWTRRLSRGVIALSLSAMALPALADSVWVRIDHPVNDPAIQGTNIQSALTDYGNLLWGQIDRSEADALQAAGVRVTVSENPFLVTLGEETFDPAQEIARFDNHRANPDGDWHLIQFNGPIRSEWIRDLRAQGVQMAQPLHPFSYLVWGNQQQIAAAARHGNVRFSGPMLPEWKVQPHLRDFDRSMRDTMALASAHVDPGQLRRQLNDFGTVLAISPLNTHFNIVHMEIPGDSYLAVAELPALYTVQYIRPEVATRGEMSNQSIVGNINSSGQVVPGYLDWLNDTGYDGSGVKVGIVDSGTNINHVDLVDNIVPCLGTEGSCGGASSGHGTHVAGGVAGTGASGVTDSGGFLRGQGVAPGASLVIQRYNPFISGAGPGGMVPNGMLRIFKDSAESGALLTNNSWGPTGTPQGYDIPTQQIDFISRDALPDVPGSQPVLAVWSIMNGNGDSGGACAPASQASPDEAKNLFAVGSTSLQVGGGAQAANIFRVSGNSAHGPACDGRQLPHIVAPGCNTDSTSPASGTTGWGLSCGTSMASPVVSGAVAVWAEKYIEQTGVNPSPALVKAVFTAAAQDLVGNPNADGGIMGHRPDRFQGYGRVDLDLVMNHGVEVFMHDQEEVFTETGQSWSIGLSAVDPNEPIRIMLAWTDAPGHGTGGTTPAWVNDLDLVVEAQGSTFLGNVIGSDGWSATGGSADVRNNLEGVFLSPGQHGGAVNVTVNAANIAADALNPWDPEDPSQDFALACYNCIVGDPTFSLAVSPSAAEFCIPDNGSESLPVNVTVGTVGQYDGTVVLSDSDIPTGISSTVSPTQVQAPGTASWTLDISSAAEAGSYLLGLSGDDGENQIARTLALQLDAFLDIAPTLQSPGDNASDLTLTPTFTWDGIESVSSYQFQLASDFDFTDLVADETVEGQSFTLGTELDTGTVYFWRVRGNNLCGGGEWSQIFVFTTRLEPVAEFSAASLSFELPANSNDTGDLLISNTGTGNLTWLIETDQLESQGFTGRFGGAFDPDNWTLVNNPTNTGGSVNVNAGPPVEVFITGGDSNVGGFTELQIEIPVDGTINFDWGYQSTDSGDFDRAGYSINGSFTQLANNANQVPFFNQSVSVEVSAGDLFGLRVVTQDGLFGAGVLGVTNFDFVPGFCEGELSTVSWLTASPDSGSVAAGDSQNVVVSINTIGLDNGDYLGYLCVSTNDPNAAMVAIPVELTVDGDAGPLPVADISPDNFALTAVTGGSDSADLLVGNLGSADLTWSVESTETGNAYGAVASNRTIEALPQTGSRSNPMAAQGRAPQRIDGTRFARAISGDWNEGFDDITALPGLGWSLINNSAPLGVTGWSQGGPDVFESHEGAPDSYISANFNNTAGNGVISNWLLTPEIELQNGTEIRFWTRSTASEFPFEDRMQVRLSTAGDSSDVGTSATSVGDFEVLLLDINPDYDANGYPEVWTEYVLVIEGLDEATTGRVAFRYFVESGGPEGDNSDYIGIDTFSVTQPDAPPPPPSCTNPAAVDWLTIDPMSGTTEVGASASVVSLTADSTDLAPGVYAALLCVNTNDPMNETVEIPVEFEVIGGDELFQDRFESLD